MAPPLLALGALLLAKKALALSLFSAGSRYGWPRLYRRALELGARTLPPAAQPALRAALARGLRLPQAAVALLRDPNVQALLAAAAESPAARAVPLAPGVSLATLLRGLQALPDSFARALAEAAVAARSGAAAAPAAAKAARGGGGSSEPPLR